MNLKEAQQKKYSTLQHKQLGFGDFQWTNRVWYQLEYYMIFFFFSLGTTVINGIAFSVTAYLCSGNQLKWECIHSVISFLLRILLGVFHKSSNRKMQVSWV